jgi:hypothetical protein
MTGPSPSSAALVRGGSTTVRHEAAIGPRTMPDKTAVDTIFVGRDRACNRRVQQMCGHSFIDPPSIGLEPMAPFRTALHARFRLGTSLCPPLVRGQWRVARSRTRSAWSAAGSLCRGRGSGATPSSTMSHVAPLVRATMANARGPLRRLGEVAPPPGDARPDDLGGVRGGAAAPGAPCGAVRPLPGRQLHSNLPRGGFHAVPASVSKTCLVRFDSEEDQERPQWGVSPTNRYSVDARVTPKACLRHDRPGRRG